MRTEPLPEYSGDEHLLPRGPLGESWPVVGPKRTNLWLRRAEDLAFCVSTERAIVPGVAVGRLSVCMAELLFGKNVLELQPGNGPVRVWLVSGRDWSE